MGHDSAVSPEPQETHDVNKSVRIDTQADVVRTTVVATTYLGK